MLTDKYYPTGVQFGTSSQTIRAMNIERNTMPVYIRARDVWKTGNVGSGGYIAWGRTPSGDEPAMTDAYGFATLHLGGIVEGDDVSKVLEYFWPIGITVQGDSVMPDASIGTQVSVVTNGAVNVVNSGRYVIMPGDDVYVLLPTTTNTREHKSPNGNVEPGAVGILVSGSFLTSKFGYLFEDGGKTHDELYWRDIALAWMFVGRALTMAGSGEYFTLSLRH